MLKMHNNHYYIHDSIKILNEHLARGLPSACLVFFSRKTKYYLKMGAKYEKIFIGYNKFTCCIDI